MFKKLLVPVDGSAHSTETLNFAISIAKQYSSELVIIHVGEITPYSLLQDDVTGWTARYISDMVDKLKITGKKILEEAEKFALKEISKVKTRFEVGNPATVICEAAQQEKCDLIVMGNRGISDLTGFFLGSVSHGVLQKSSCPVLLVKGSSKREAELASIRATQKASKDG